MSTEAINIGIDWQPTCRLQWIIDMNSNEKALVQWWSIIRNGQETSEGEWRTIHAVKINETQG